MFLLKPGVLTEGDQKLPDIPQDEPVQAPAGRWKRQGDVMKVESHGFDYAVWKLGGAAIYLRLVQLASVSLRIVGSCADNNISPEPPRIVSCFGHSHRWSAKQLAKLGGYGTIA